ncbi:MAG: hypothetical protein EAZ08_06365 [Cytophagales bacterium]|nr:MAG: hypothetical protein EAZ08_06365 [Cytophagales bacterium]
MSRFSFPRLNFSGNINIDVPTGNNSRYYPLSYYDPVNAKSFLPPRIYLSAAQMEEITEKYGPHFPIIKGENEQSHYIEIQPIDNATIFKQWAVTPLGEFDADKNYVPIYEITQPPDDPWLGNPPGYWNYWGSMSVTMLDVKVNSVTSEDGLVLTKLPDRLQYLIGSTLSLNSVVDNDKTATACLVETDSNLSIYAGIFNSKMTLYNEDKIIFSGKPQKASAQIYNTWRVLNWTPPMASSATFCGVIPIEDLEDTENSPIITLFSQYNKLNQKLKGVFFAYNVLEVFENRFNPNLYKDNNYQPISNAAQASVIGSLSPWYEGDMKSSSIGRQLVSFGQNPITLEKGKQYLAPAQVHFQKISESKAILSLDLLNTVPETVTKFVPKPCFRGDAAFETYQLGELIINAFSQEKEMDVLSFRLDQANYGRKQLCLTSGMMDFVITDKTQIDFIDNNYLQLVWVAEADGKKERKVVLKETPYMLMSDQKGMYAQQGDNPTDGFMSYSRNLEPCTIRIYSKGKPVITPIPVYVLEYQVPDTGEQPNLLFASTPMIQYLKDGDTVNLATQPDKLTLTNNMVYYFCTEDFYPANAFPNFSDPQGNYAVMDTGSFVCLRVLPKQDYTAHQNEQNIPFEVLYKEIFSLYDVVYPIMGLIVPFDAENWQNGTMAGMTVQRTDVNIWERIEYMGRSRELSEAQRQLILKWAAQFNVSPSS